MESETSEMRQVSGEQGAGDPPSPIKGSSGYHSVHEKTGMTDFV